MSKKIRGWMIVVRRIMDVMLMITKIRNSRSDRMETQNFMTKGILIKKKNTRI